MKEQINIYIEKQLNALSVILSEYVEPQKPLVSTEIIDNFPENIADLPLRELMNLWTVCTAWETYTLQQLARVDTQVMTYKVIQNYVYNLYMINMVDTETKKKFSSKELRESYVVTRPEYIEAEDKLLSFELQRKILDSYLKSYNEKSALCSRDLTRRGAVNEMDNKLT